MNIGAMVILYFGEIISFDAASRIYTSLGFGLFFSQAACCFNFYQSGINFEIHFFCLFVKKDKPRGFEVSNEF